MARPPTPIGIERRLFERVMFYADVTLLDDDRVISLRAKDLSTGGLAVEVSRGEAPEVKPGMVVDVQIDFRSENGDTVEIRARAKVTRREDPADAGFGAIGFAWVSDDPAVRKAVDQIIGYLNEP